MCVRFWQLVWKLIQPNWIGMQYPHYTKLCKNQTNFEHPRWCTIEHEALESMFVKHVLNQRLKIMLVWENKIVLSQCRGCCDEQKTLHNLRLAVDWPGRMIGLANLLFVVSNLLQIQVFNFMHEAWEIAILDVRNIVEGPNTGYGWSCFELEFNTCPTLVSPYTCNLLRKL